MHTQRERQLSRNFGKNSTYKSIITFFKTIREPSGKKQAVEKISKGTRVIYFLPG